MSTKKQVATVYTTVHGFTLVKIKGVLYHCIWKPEQVEHIRRIARRIVGDWHSSWQSCKYEQSLKDITFTGTRIYF